MVKMNKIEKNKLYNETCGVLTDYEQTPMSAEEACQILYDQLAKIMNWWEELTGRED
jgi:hypothetical protein